MEKEGEVRNVSEIRGLPDEVQNSELKRAHEKVEEIERIEIKITRGRVIEIVMYAVIVKKTYDDVILKKYHEYYITVYDNDECIVNVKTKDRGIYRRLSKEIIRKYGVYVGGDDHGTE